MPQINECSWLCMFMTSLMLFLMIGLKFTNLQFLYNYNTKNSLCKLNFFVLF